MILQMKTMNKEYKLLPFNFTRISGEEILVNELGDMIVSPKGTVYALVNRQPIDEELYKSLVANFFISENYFSPMMDVYAARLHEKKSYLDDFTALHIFVLTLRCNQNCVYCHASSQDEASLHCSMSKHTMEKSVELMFKSPSPTLTMEFQGGEPTLEVDLIRFGIEKAEEINKTEKRKLEYVLCTNSIRLTDEIMDICQQYNVYISTSLDGPSWLHNTNRGKADSYEKVVLGIEKARKLLGHDHVSALMTASELGVEYPIEIVDEYVKLGFNDIFLRALNPYGLARNNSDWDAYTDKFIDFYKRALDHIIELNLAGTFFMEDFAVIILRKMLTPYSTGFVDLQSPAGIINSVLVYNYDGYVYASDESRMLAEYNDFTFRLGQIDDNYEDIVRGEKAKSWGKIWCNETLAGCSDCPLKTYCGADPVRNYSTQGDPYGYRPNSWLCKKYKAIISYIIELIVERHDEVMPVFKSWLQ